MRVSVYINKKNTIFSKQCFSWCCIVVWFAAVRHICCGTILHGEKEKYKQHQQKKKPVALKQPLNRARDKESETNNRMRERNSQPHAHAAALHAYAHTLIPHTETIPPLHNPRLLANRPYKVCK